MTGPIYGHWLPLLVDDELVRTDLGMGQNLVGPWFHHVVSLTDMSFFGGAMFPT